MENRREKKGESVIRDPNRIKSFCDYLATVWETYFPDWRFGQLIENIIDWENTSPFYLEESDWIDLINRFVGEFGASSYTTGVITNEN